VLTVVARDRVCDLVDCAAVLDGPHEWRDLRLDEIARRLAAPYGVQVLTEADAGPAFPRFEIQPGETAWEALSRAATARGVLLAGTGAGALRLTRASLAKPAAGPIVLGQNVRRARGVFDHSQRHSVVCVRGQAEGGAIPRGVHAADGTVAEGGERTLSLRGQGRAEDAAVRRFRPRVILGETAGEAGSFADRAKWAVRHAAGQGTRVAYVVPGWRGATGALWRTNTLAQIADPWLGVDAGLLIATVVFSLTPTDGTVTEVEVTLPDAYDIVPIPLKPAAGGSGRGAAASPLGLFDVTDPARPQRLPPPA
jgi:prophage tail gpP-like protein